MDNNRDNNYIPDEYDSIFESFDEEEDKKLEAERERELIRQEEKTEMIRTMIDGLKAIMDKGLCHETSKEIRSFLGRNEDGFSGGNPDIYRQRCEYAKDESFRKGLIDLCNHYDFDKPSLTCILRILYPGDGSENVTNMRKFLLSQRLKAPYRPLKKMNYPLAAIVIGLVYACLVFWGLSYTFAFFPAALIGVHWFLYRLLYDRYGMLGTHLRIGLAIMLILFFYEEKVIPDGEGKDSMITFVVFYFDMLGTLGLAKLGVILREAADQQAIKPRSGPVMK